MYRCRILVVEDDVSYQSVLERFLKKEFNIKVVGDCSQAMKQVGSGHFDLLLMDIKLPDGSGLDLMDKIRHILPSVPVIVMTGGGSAETAIQAIQRGAFHYLTKPFSLTELKHLVDKAIHHHRLEKENYWYHQELKSKYQFDNIIGNSPAILEVFKLVEKIAQSDSTVLIQGGSGTGKELIAKAIHYNSPRSEKPLVTVNCGALPEELLESELFGHVKGAFTGAHVSRQGRFELADQGTIFLDEVGDMSPRLQVKLLRVLQEQKFEPVGTSQTIQVNVRIIAATHQDLEVALEEKRFREDLYYRLNVIPIVVPTLARRSGDIPLLLVHFLEKFNREQKKNVTGFSKEVTQALCQYEWPGHVRELENLVERLVILKGEGEILSRDLPDKYFSVSLTSQQSLCLPPEGMDFNQTMETIENELIRQALMRTAGNKNKAAGLLRLKRTTLVEKLKRKKAIF